MQALTWEVSRALTKLGMATAASRPMMATTIMISTNVNPPLERVRIFTTRPFSRCGVNAAAGGLLYYYDYLSTNCLLQPQLGFKQVECHSERKITDSWSSGRCKRKEGRAKRVMPQKL